jgi:hypothetical protein
MTRDDRGRLRLDCKLGTYFHSLSTSEALDPELMEATQRRRRHVVPSGMFQPFIPSESDDLLRGQFSVFATVAREFVEELYGVEELRVDVERRVRGSWG